MLRLHSKIEKNKIDKLVKLPSIIISKNDFFVFQENKSIPNFITQKKIIAEVIYLDKENIHNISKKIVIIPSADPGYDWLFSHPISGLITKYGGANSHMAIRCAELGLPAAIGVGENLFEKILNKEKILLDCLNEKIEDVK